MQERFSNPAPLGLTAFGMTTVLLNLHNIGLYGLDSMILAMGIFYGGIAQAIAGIEGVICGLSAIYVAVAEVLNEVYGRIVLPIGPVSLRAKA